MPIQEEIKRVINSIDKLHPNDTKIYEYWDDLTLILVRNEEETIDLLITTNDENVIDNLSSVFSDVSYKLQSKKFTEALELIEGKFPNLLLRHMIEAAKGVLL